MTTGNRTFTMIKPIAVKNNNIGAILRIINEADFRIVALKMVQMNKSQAERFYEVHKGKEFYGRLTDFMCSGPVVAVILEKENAVVAYRKLIGATDPKDAEEGTIRRLYAESKSHNAVHGSDSDENAKVECDFFFSEIERFEND